MKRLLDIIVAGAALVVLSPLMLLAAVGIRMTDRGPVFYRARRVARDRRTWTRRATKRSDRRCAKGYGGHEFVMFKFRTMRVVADENRVVITAPDDARIYPFGAFLRATKIDEIPQLLNVLKGDMTLVGPRPEEPEIVRSYYQPDDLETLTVRPGVTSPGTIYYYTRCEQMLAADSVMDQYTGQLMPLKLALDRVYIKRATVLYDIRLLARTVAGVTAKVIGIWQFPDPPELAEVPPDRRLAFSGRR